MISLTAMLKRMSGLTDTRDLSEWENTFITSVLNQSDQGRDTSRLSSKQAEVIERIFNKHFGA